MTGWWGVSFGDTRPRRWSAPRPVVGRLVTPRSTPDDHRATYPHARSRAIPEHAAPARWGCREAAHPRVTTHPAGGPLRSDPSRVTARSEVRSTAGKPEGSSEETPPHRAEPHPVTPHTRFPKNSTGIAPLRPESGDSQAVANNEGNPKPTPGDPPSPRGSPKTGNPATSRHHNTHTGGRQNQRTRHRGNPKGNPKPTPGRPHREPQTSHTTPAAEPHPSPTTRRNHHQTGALRRGSSPRAAREQRRFRASEEPEWFTQRPPKG